MKILISSLLVVFLSMSMISCSESNDSIDAENKNTEDVLSEMPPYYPINFEADGYGATWTWSVFENGNNPAVEIVDNPSKTGVNTSNKVAKITALQVGSPYVGCETKHGSDIGSFTFDETNTTVKIMVYKSVISDVGIKFSESNGEAQPEIKVSNTKINEWEELTFDFSGSIGKGISGIIDQIIIFPDYQSRNADHVVYFDHITFGN
ncbi:glycosyl hydrolase family 16 [Wenyingzhuangia sp. chi5]|uniref:Glycosyl hydrolase family 16 n=1 Tax=Wenyingzhuangia gilva TaxID=3057677 RepID=A0ABT8VU71_9FLAO|nr:glycosyl hydrolase family 16 [Wenyingzhuangia sp. chi5]MDO3695516.1 glycosyl hydrolase family 16 [Wenyingzhuangia sp. chi5]